jgi:hypothetical protein
VSAERRAACVGDSRVSERHADRGPPAPYAFRLPRSPHELAHALALAARKPQTQKLMGNPSSPARESGRGEGISVSLTLPSPRAQVSHYLGSRGSRHRCGGAKGFPGQHRPASVSGGGSVSAERRAACVGDSRVSERHADRGPPAPYAFRLPRSPHELAHALALAARDPQAVAPEVDGKPEPRGRG